MGLTCGTPGPRARSADHTELDLLVLDHAGAAARPWLTVVLDDCSRAVAGYSVFLGAPSALNLSLALRQAIWHKSDSETGRSPEQAWLGDGWLPRTPDTLEQLDLLLVMVAKARIVHRDGIRFQGLRFLEPTLAAYVGEPVTIRYDPRDLGEIRVYHHNRFLYRAISPEHAGQAITLKDIQTARNAHRRALREQLSQRRAAVAEYLPSHPAAAKAPPAPRRTDPAPGQPPRARLHTYLEDTT